MTAATIVLLSLIVLCLATSALVVVKFYRRLTKTLMALEQTLYAVEHTAQGLSELKPRTARFLDEAGGELIELRGLTRRTTAVTADVQAITGEIRAGAEVLNLAMRSQAVVAGARAGFEALRRASGDTNGKGEDHEH